MLFVDTGGFYAAADRSDRYHEVAAIVFAQRAASGDMVTSDHVLVETWLLLRGRLGRDAAMRFWDALRGGVVQVLGVTAKDLARARQIAAEWPDQAFSLVDCTSFALIERHGVVEAMAFDRHFRVFRYGAGRHRALTLPAV